MARKGRSVLHHISTLIWKNRIIKQRHWVTTLLEVAIPTLFVLLFAYFKTLTANETIPEGWQINTSPQPVVLAMPAYDSLLKVPTAGFTPYFVGIEPSMSGLLLGLSYMAYNDMTAASSKVPPASCKIPFTYMGYVNSDASAKYAIPSSCGADLIPYKIAIVPKNAYTVNYFGGIMANWYPRIPLSNTSLTGFNAELAIPAFADSVMYFETADALESYLSGSDYGTSAQNPYIYAGIVFESTPAPGVTGDVEYTLRMNSTQGRGGSAGIIPHTSNKQYPAVNLLQKSIDLTWLKTYTTQGFATLQTLMAKFLACAPTYSSPNVGSCSTPKSAATTSIPLATKLGERLLAEPVFYSGLNAMIRDPNVGNVFITENVSTFAQQIPLQSMANLLLPLLQAPQSYLGSDVYPFPTQKYISAPFYDTVASVFPLVFILAYLYAVSKVLVVLIQEKETKARELMKILGVSESAIVLSWFLTYLVIFLVASVLQALAGTLLFPNTSGGILWVFFFLFSITIWAYGFIVSTFFTNARTGSLVGVSLFFVMYFVSSGLSQATEGAKMLASLLAPVALALCIQTLAAAEGVSVGITSATSNTVYSNYRFAGGLGMLVLDFILYTLLAIYLEQVIPKDYGTPQKWYFPVSPSYWFGSSSRGPAKVGEAKVMDPTVVNDAIEPVSNELQNQEHNGDALQIAGIRK
ncbi:ATP-binding Cassette (ABC) Superfamily, partial [Achlya hypogyna]